MKAQLIDGFPSTPEKPKFDNLRMISGATEPPLAMMKGFAEFAPISFMPMVPRKPRPSSPQTCSSHRLPNGRKRIDGS
ncbi:hypothetical protein [Desulfosarcina cetonica]|uniref:hypothetical protein n=1 Tax=Desulfosarcina cetonica TaxID=90730 RepID=UPI001FEE9573|nr:hypothetical protein [Desulfosarcina cetonica]